MGNSKRVDCYGSSSSSSAPPPSSPPPVAETNPLPVISSEQRRFGDNNNQFQLTNLSNLFAMLYFSEERHLDARLIEEIEKNDIKIINNEDIEEIDILGSGGVAEIWLGKYNGEHVCIQKIRKDRFAGYGDISCIKNTAIDPFWRDVHIMNMLKHDNIVKFLGVVLDDPHAPLKKISEKMPHSSYRHVWQDNQRVLTKLEKLKIAKDAASGLEYMHSKDILFYELKSSNLLLDLRASEPKCKLGDMGIFNFDLKIGENFLDLGSLQWKAPELISQRIRWNNGVTEKIDVFSFGIVLWELLTGKFPYQDIKVEKGEDVKSVITEGVMSNTLRPDMPEDCDLEWANLIEKCWHQDPKIRPSFTEIVGHLNLMIVPTKNRTAGYRKPKKRTHLSQFPY